MGSELGNILRNSVSSFHASIVHPHCLSNSVKTRLCHWALHGLGSHSKASLMAHQADANSSYEGENPSSMFIRIFLEPDRARFCDAAADGPLDDLSLRILRLEAGVKIVAVGACEP